ncbi:MAG: alkylation response protein AidB-like acyl-CoA dehydrogenase [Halioglobus sp.]|jgi:alkylation response protein AidB-like acyl-CoA dehydrogenase
MDFSFNEDQNAIRALASQIFTDRTSDEFMMDFSRAGHTYDDTLWSTLAQQGLLGITVPEEFGGTGLGFTELCLILEEQGRRISPVPLYASLVLGVLPIVKFGTDEQKAKYLAPLAAGELKLTAAIAELGICAAAAGQVSASQQGDTWTLTGALACVPDSPVADVIIVPATTAHGTTVFIVDTRQSGVSVDAQLSSLGHNEGNLTLNNVELNEATILGAADKGQIVLDWLELRAETALCALQLGVTEEALKRTAAFTCERKQFGAPIGTFQAVAMQAADAFIDVEAIRSTYWLALYKLNSGQDARAEVRCAKWYAADAGHRIVYRTQHLHGGIGVDMDYPIHRFFLWAKHLGLMLGGRSVQISKLGALLASDDSVGIAALQIQA